MSEFNLFGKYKQFIGVNLFTGHFLAIDATEDDTLRIIPTELMQFSVNENANVEHSLAYLTEASNDPENVDSIIK